MGSLRLLVTTPRELKKDIIHYGEVQFGLGSPLNSCPGEDLVKPMDLCCCRVSVQCFAYIFDFWFQELITEMGEEFQVCVRITRQDRNLAAGLNNSK